MSKAMMLLSAALALPAPATGQPSLALETGNDFIATCAGEPAALAWGMCHGYLRGFRRRDSIGPSLFCLPPNVTNRQVFDVVLQHIADRPQTRHLELKFLVAEAFRAAFPCPQREG